MCTIYFSWYYYHYNNVVLSQLEQSCTITYIDNGQVFVSLLETDCAREFSGILLANVGSLVVSDAAGTIFEYKQKKGSHYFFNSHFTLEKGQLGTLFPVRLY